jgi:1-acyl-sn-glycerol-3-phosphate acyltransferase
LGEFGHGPAIIGVARGHLARQQLALVIDDHVQFEAINPAHGGFAALRQATKDPMLPNAAVMTHGQWGRVHKRNAATVAQAGLQIGAERTNGWWHQFHKALLAHGLRKLAVQLAAHIRQVLGLEVTKPHLVKVNHAGHTFAHG